MLRGCTQRDLVTLALVWGAAAALGVAALTRDWLGGVVAALLAALVFAAIAWRALMGRGAAMAEVLAAPVAAPLAVAPGASATPQPAATPAAAPVAAEAAPAVMVRPSMLPGAHGGTPDDLKRLRGVGPKLEALLHRLGVFHFDQIAAWTQTEIAWMDEHLEGFRGRVTRDDWVGQARMLAAGGSTDFAARVDAGDVPTSRA